MRADNESQIHSINNNSNTNQLFDLKQQPLKPSQQSKSNFTFNKAKCINGSQCFQICAFENCLKQAIVCANKNCQCRKHHKKLCSWVDPMVIVDLIQEKRISSSQLIEFIMKKFDNLIDEISSQRDRIVEEMNTIGLTSVEKSFLRCIEKEEFQKLDGQMVNKIQKSLDLGDLGINNNSSGHYSMETVLLTIDTKWSKIVQNIQKDFSTLTQFISSLSGKDFEAVMVNTSINSRIISDFDSFEILQRFIKQQQDKTPTTFDLLYRASENDFDTDSFWKICNGVGNTCTVIKTKTGKVIGGYTPIKWDRSKSINYQQDSSLKSFIFSISENVKLKLRSSETGYAVRHNAQLGPIFGQGRDLAIYDRANKNKESYAKIGNTYGNSEFVKGNGSNYWLKFTGNEENCHFEAEEWEVFRVSFES